MSKVLVTESYLSDIASAIRNKLSVSDAFKPSEMAPGIMSISGGGDVTIESLSISENGTYTASEGYAFSPVVVDVESGGVQPSALSVSENGTYSAPSGYAFDPVTVNVAGGGGDIDLLINGTITSLYTLASKIRDYAFMRCSSLASIVMPNVEHIGMNAFFNCYRISGQVSFPNVKTVGTNAFGGATIGGYKEFPELVGVSSSAFAAMSAAGSYSFPKLSTCYSASIFFGNEGTTAMYFGAITRFGDRTFGRCTALMSLFLDVPNVPTWGNMMFESCAILTKSSAKIYVRSSLIDAFKSASGWSNASLVSKYYPIEEYAF